MPFVCFYCLEFYTHDPWLMAFIPQLINYLLFLAAGLFLYELTGRSWCSTVFMSIYSLAAGIVNYFVMSFRNNPLLPWDLKSAKTALSVSDNYNYDINYRFIVSTVVLLLMLRSLSLPTILVLSIEGAIWLNLSVPYLMSKPIFYIAYLIISSVQLGATVDYAILMTDRYIENRLRLNKHDAVVETISNVTVSILTSGSALVVVGFLLGYISSNQLLAQLGVFIGRGAVFSLLIVLFALPGLLYLFDRLVMRGSAAAPAKEPFFPDISHTK